MAGCSISRNAQDIGLWSLGFGGIAANVCNTFLTQHIQQQQAEFNTCCLQGTLHTCTQIFQRVVDCPALQAAIHTNNEWSKYLFVTVSAAGFILTTTLFLRSCWKPVVPMRPLQAPQT